MSEMSDDIPELVEMESNATKIRYAFRIPDSLPKQFPGGLPKCYTFVKADQWLHPKPSEISVGKQYVVAFDFVSTSDTLVINGESMEYVGSFTGEMDIFSNHFDPFPLSYSN